MMFHSMLNAKGFLALAAASVCMVFLITTCSNEPSQIHRQLVGMPGNEWTRDVAQKDRDALKRPATVSATRYEDTDFWKVVYECWPKGKKTRRAEVAIKDARPALHSDIAELIASFLPGPNGWTLEWVPTADVEKIWNKGDPQKAICNKVWGKMLGR